MCRFKVHLSKEKYKMKRLDVKPGQRFYMLTIVEELPIGKNGRMFLCQCDCGNVKPISLVTFTRKENITKSCGCHRMNLRTKHGMWESREYSTWENMIQRCLNPKSNKYYLYGGRGITVCERWLKSFQAFYEDMGSRPDNTSLDRIEGDKGYYKENCKWSNPREQLVNVRYFSANVTYSGITMSVEEWIKYLKIDREIFKTRVLRGLGFKDSLFNTFDIIVLDTSTNTQTLHTFDKFVVITKFDKDKLLELIDSDHNELYHGYLIRYLTGFTSWPEEYCNNTL